MTARIAAQPPVVEKPEHRLSQLTTCELRDYCRELEKAIAFFGQQHPVPPARAALQSRLDAVIAEQADRQGISAGRRLTIAFCKIIGVGATGKRDTNKLTCYVVSLTRCQSGRYTVRTAS